MNETQSITNSTQTFCQQNSNLTGKGLPQYKFGVNRLLVSVVPRIDANYRIPPNTNIFAAELNGKKPRSYMCNGSIQRSIGNKWLAEIAYVGSQGRRVSKRDNTSGPVGPGDL